MRRQCSFRLTCAHLKDRQLVGSFGEFTTPLQLERIIRWRLRSTGLVGGALARHEVHVDVCSLPIFDPRYVIASLDDRVMHLHLALELPLTLAWVATEVRALA